MLKRRRNRSPALPPTCALSVCMRYLSGVWTPNILWHLNAGARRFSELKHDLKGVSAKTLTQCLRRLEATGLVVRNKRPTSPPSVEYELTALGLSLQPALEALVAVGHQLKLRGKVAK